MNDRLAEYVGTPKGVRITRRFPGDRYLRGYVLGLSEELVLMHVFHDFEPDGYTICRVEDITQVRHCPYEEWFDHMLRSEGLLGGLKLPSTIDLADMHHAILSISRSYDQMIIECEDPIQKEEDFYIGTLASASKRILRFLDYDALGFWAVKAKSIEVANVTKVQFDAPYIRVFSKYVRKGRPPKFPEYDG